MEYFRWQMCQALQQSQGKKPEGSWKREREGDRKIKLMRNGKNITLNGIFVRRIGNVGETEGQIEMTGLGEKT